MAKFDVKTMAKPVGRMPVLQFLVPSELEIEPTYQRSIEGGESQRLIRSIAQDWNWDLCQPLVVSHREGHYYVIDGQHRLEAAKLRGDIMQLPCVLGQYADVKSEAATFTALNGRRRPLSALEKFKAAIAAGDTEAVAVNDALSQHGFSLAAHTNHAFWKVGQLGNVAGIKKSWRRCGEKPVNQALAILQAAYGDQVLRYAGTLLPALATVCTRKGGEGLSSAQVELLTKTLRSKPQGHWYGLALRIEAANEHLGRSFEMVKVMRAALEGKTKVDNLKLAEVSRPAVVPQARPASATGQDLDNYDAVSRGAKRHCDQCDRLRSDADVAICTSQWCKLRDVA